MAQPRQGIIIKEFQLRKSAIYSLDQKKVSPDGCTQRIYIYKEYKANSPRLPTGDIYPRKQEAVKKTTSEILSAVLRSLLCGVCVYLT